MSDHNNKDQIEVSFIEDFPSVKEGLFSLVPHLSKQKLKKQNLNKNFLNKKITYKDSLFLPIDLLNIGLINSSYKGKEHKIIYEDINFLVIEKNYNTHIHPLKYTDNDSLLNWLYSKKNKYMNTNIKNYDRGLLNRLDYETSGIVYYAKSNEVYKELRTSFNTMIKQKTYLCIVHGKVENNQSIQHYLKPIGPKGNTVKTQSFEEEGATKATISCNLLYFNKSKNLSLVAIELNEGHRHQIRVQLSAIGHPILGDIKYGGDKSERLYLHCYSYVFNYLNIQYDLKSTEYFEVNHLFNLEQILLP